MTVPASARTDPRPDLTRHAYQRIAADLRAQIRAGRWLPGALLPSRRRLAQEYGVELGTLQQAISGLLADGTLKALPRQGTVVGPAACASILPVPAPPPSRPPWASSPDSIPSRPARAFSTTTGSGWSCRHWNGPSRGRAGPRGCSIGMEAAQRFRPERPWLRCAKPARKSWPSCCCTMTPPPSRTPSPPGARTEGRSSFSPPVRPIGPCPTSSTTRSRPGIRPPST